MGDLPRKIQVLVADDHSVVRLGVRSLLGRQADLVVVGEAASAEELARRSRELRPDVVLTDLRMPPGDAVVVIRELVAELPATRVVVFSAFDEPVEAARALGAGAMGYVLKQSDGADLVTAVRRAHAGRRYVDEAMAARVLEDVGVGGVTLLEQPARLSENEERVLELVARGYTGPQIAIELGVRVGTVESYRHRIRRKLGLKSRAEVTDFVRRTGFSRRRSSGA